MNLRHLSQKELLDIAKTSDSQEVLDKLVSSPDATIRRAVARNSNTSSSTLEKLAYDAVENVSFMAVQNPQCKIDRTFKISNPCVVCEKDERTMECTDCDTLGGYYINLDKK